MDRHDERPMLMRAASMRARSTLALALFVSMSASATGTAATKAKDKSAPAMPTASRDTTVCDSLKKTLMGRISSMKSLEVGITKEREKPAATLSGLFSELAGGSYEGVAIKKKMRRLERERAMAVELNRLLASSNCPQVDIDAELQKAKADAAADDDASGSNDPLANDPLRNKIGR
jgi:hypothetical protein